MPVALLFAAFILGAAALNGRVAALGTQANKDLFGSNGQVGFLEWAGAVLFIGAVMKTIDIPRAGKALIALVLITFLLADNGLFASLQQQIASLKNPGTGQNMTPAVAPGLRHSNHRISKATPFKTMRMRV
jgi:hypothetical protein